ncbi:unnamed protein product [Protopolystoma xenopodis]|uniref:Uncharacterized protein n=1 Tax=Protopolystoma xenopodis TaxID=117903 RepID=A0A448WFU7_9PLAT|nr:unnamed protein product [Protopolystoma xenopodis]
MTRECWYVRTRLAGSADSERADPKSESHEDESVRCCISSTLALTWRVGSTEAWLASAVGLQVSGSVDSLWCPITGRAASKQAPEHQSRQDNWRRSEYSGLVRLVWRCRATIASLV